MKRHKKHNEEEVVKPVLDSEHIIDRIKGYEEAQDIANVTLEGLGNVYDGINNFRLTMLNSKVLTKLYNNGVTRGNGRLLEIHQQTSNGLKFKYAFNYTSIKRIDRISDTTTTNDY